jgi:serine/threonine-protein kinase
MQLRASGHEADACPKFAESKNLVPAIGVTLYLADCYEKTGRNASAWREFREAEQLARAHEDKRAEVASTRAAALEPKVNRLTIATSAAEAKPGKEIRLDGAPLPAAFWNAPLAVDPGDHVVTVAAGSQPVRTLNVHVEPENLLTILKVEDIAPPLAPATPAAPAAVPASAPAEAVAAAPPASHGSAAGQWGGPMLVVAGGVGIGVGAWYLTSKTRQTENGVVCEPQLRPHAVPIGVAAIAAGGVAVVSGVAIYLLSRPGHSEVSMGPSMLPGGGGAELRGTF